MALRVRDRRRALAEIDAIALFHPWVRPRAAATDPDVLPAGERRRIVDEWVAVHPERWAVLAGAVGDVEEAEHRLVESALRAAAGDAKPCARDGLEELEALPGAHPANALAAVIPPSTVWDYSYARAAAAACAHGDRNHAIASVAFAAFPTCQPRLVDRLAWVERQLPFSDFPVASSLLRDGLDFVRAQRLDEFSCAVLEGYVRLLEQGWPELHHFVEVT